MHPEAEGSVRQALIGVRSEVAEVTEAGRVEEAEYVPVHAEAVGSVMQPLSAVTSVLRVDTEDVIPGMEDDPL